MVIYKITNTVNNKVYIGQTVQYSTRRINNHKYYLRLGKHYSTHLQQAWNKYGEDKFTFENIDSAQTIEELNDKEQHWIKFYNSVNPVFGYNKDHGGQNKRMTEENKEKQRNRMLGNTYSLGKKQNLSKEQREQRRQNTRNKNLGHKHSEQTKKKIGDAFRGEKSIFYGKPGVNRKSVIFVNGNKKYDSILAASKDLKCCRKSIRAVLQGKQKTIRGMKFIYGD